MKRLDPRTKLALGVMGLIAALITQKPVTLYGEMGLLCLALAVFKPLPECKGALKLILPVVGLVFGIAFFSFDLQTALLLCVRLFNLLAFSFVFFRGLDPEEMGAGLRKLRIPYAVTFILTTSMRYVPLISTRIRRIMDAQRSRGIDLRPRFKNIPNFMALLMPLLVQCFILSEQLAVAMESRGFARRGRSFRRDYHIPLPEYGIMIASLSLLVIFIRWERG
jgi:energy-coupling factor transport system permease protein